MRILCDLDGVVSDFMDSFTRCYQDAGGFLPGGWVPESYDSINRLPDPLEVAAAWNDQTLFSKMRALPGAVVAMEHLNSKHDVRIVTTIVPPWGVHIPARMEWIEVFLPFIGREQIYIAHDKTPIDGDLLIEDYPPNLQKWLIERDCTSARGALIDQPWNQEDNLAGLDRWDMPVRWDRHDGLIEFVEKL